MKDLYTVRGPFGGFYCAEWAYSKHDALKRAFGTNDESWWTGYSASIEG